METTHYPQRAGLLGYVLSVFLFSLTSFLIAQPTVTVRLANPSYDCITGDYCLDVEFKSSQQDAQLFGMNVRLFYDDNILELIGFSDFQGGYGPVSPDPPTIATNGPAGPALFNFSGPADFVNGAIQLLDTTNSIPLDTIIWTKIFSICFTIDDPGIDLSSFCPSIVWDLEQNPDNGGFLIGDDGVVMTIVDPDPFIETAPVDENVIQFNWIYIGEGSAPYGQPVETECIPIDCSPMLTCAADITVECTSEKDPSITGFATATDLCPGEPTISFNDVTTAGSCPVKYTIERTWIATNTCNLSDTCIQIISVVDTQPPVITCPPNALVTCASQVPPVNTGSVTTTDACGGIVNVTHLGDAISNLTCVNRYTLTRTYRATDACGNSSSCSQIITVFDNVPPSITCPDDIILDLGEDTTPQNTGIATGTDNCGGVPVITSNDITVEGLCQEEYVIHRTWTAADACGNLSTCLQVIGIAGNCQVDLSLIKTTSPGQGVIEPGDDVDFTITVTNEGEVTIGEIHLIDYIPLGFILNDPDWTAGILGSTGQSASIVLSVSNGGIVAGGLLPTQSVSVEITLSIDPNIPSGVYYNISEITSMFDINGLDVSSNDVDSNPDTDDTNDPPAEDDQDPETICLLEAPVILGERFVCPGDIVIYTVGNYNPAHTYTFNLVNGGGIVLGTTPSSITIAWDDQTGGPYEISLTEVATIDCEATSSIFVNIEGGEAVACIDHTNISIDNECGTVVLSGMILTGDQAGINNFQVFIIDMNGDTIPNATLTWEHVGQTFKISIRSICTGQSCWGFLTVEDKLPPVIDCVCPLNGENENCNINCLQVNDFLNGEIPEELRPIVVDNCGGTTLEIINEDFSFASCINGYLRVTWKATDGSGNTSTCEQQFDIVPIPLGNIQFPLDYVGPCDSSVDPSVTGWPHIGDLNLTDDGPICNLNVVYHDLELHLCGGGRKIIRSWNIIDWCGGRALQSVQTIKLEDHEGPVITCPADMLVGTEIWYCHANVSLSKPIAIDECSSIDTYKLTCTGGTVFVNGNNYIIQGLPIGTYTATWTVKDVCGNSSKCSFKITVVDNVPPIVVCDLHTVVSLTKERANGVTLVPAEVFNDGSFDNCGNVTFRARRMDSCIDFNWTTGGACVDDIPGGVPPVNDFDKGTAYGTCVPFACCDVGDRDIMVQLEVSDEAGNVNYCMVQVEVQDKFAPELTCPPSIHVSCEFLFEAEEGIFRDAEGNHDGTLDEDPLSQVFGNMYDAFEHTQAARQHIIINDPNNPEFSQPHDWGLEGWAVDNCETNLTVVVNVIDDCSGASFPIDHPRGAVKLIQRSFIGNDGVQSGSCLQNIWVIDYDRFNITDTTCNNENPLDGVIWPCDILVSTCTNDLGDTGEPIIIDDGCSLIGLTHDDERFDFAEGACYKILRTWKVLDWCQFNPNTGSGLWTYVQAIKVIDSEGAEFLDAPSGPVAYCLTDPGISLPANNQLNLGENDLDASSCSVHVNLGLHVHEACSESVLYDVKFYPYNGPDYFQLVPTTEIGLDVNHEAEISFNTLECSIPSISENGLPYNSSDCNDYHRIVWSVEDGCGNRSYADYLIKLEDCKPPTPVCIDGLSTVIMPPEGEVTIFASNFNASSVDDCTPGDELLFSFSGASYQPSFTYTCDNVPAFGVEFEVEIWAADAGVDQNCNGTIEWSERNKDFCTTTLVITDNNNVCDNEGGILAGEIVTELISAVSNVTVKLISPENSFPETVTAEDGKFNFSHLPLGSDYTIVPQRNDNFRNGVSTLDLVYIQKHLLGLEPFTSPYQYIAADANNSNSISAIDLIEIRKLVLGIQDVFPYNQSWRFVHKGIEMSPGNPWPFSEDIKINHLDTEAGSGMDFVGVKIGDVNNTVQANASQILPRSAKREISVKATCHGKIEVGEDIEIELEFPEVVSGFQWTLETNGLEYVSISSEDIQINDQNVGLLSNGVITMSWNGNTSVESSVKPGMSLKLKFKVTQAGRLINMISLDGKVTPIEAYTTEGDILDVNLAFNSSGVFTDFALYQNKPNPWNNQTLIGFHIPEDASATLTIYDIDGKVIKSITGHYKAGYNSVVLSIKDIPASGVLYYRLESGSYSASKKMIVIQ